MKTILYTLILLTLLSFAATAQTKNMNLKIKNDFMLRMHQPQNFRNQKFGLKINPYWQDVDAPHIYNSFIPSVKIPCFNSLWAKVGFDSVGIDTKYFLQTANYGKTWRYDTITAPEGYVIGGLAPLNGDVCYAAAYNSILGAGGGLFKTVNGGITWKQLEPGKLFNSSSVPQFVYFFDAQHGFTIGNGNGPGTPFLEIYTTSDAGITWKRVPRGNIPAVNGIPFVNDFAGLWVAGTRIWFQGFDTNGGVYIYRSDDLGYHWQVFPFTLSKSYAGFSFADKLNGLAVGFDGSESYEAVSHDGGATWNEMNFTGYLPGVFITAIPYTRTFVSTLNGSAYSNDYGKSWILIDSEANAQHTAVAFLNPFIGWTGRGESTDLNGGMYKWKLHFSLDDKAIAVNDVNNSSATKTDLNNAINARLYPNPAKDIVRIEGLNALTKTTLSLFSISGKLIQQASLNGENYQFNIQKLAAGNYYIQIQSGEKTATLKFVKG